MGCCDSRFTAIEDCIVGHVDLFLACCTMIASLSVWFLQDRNSSTNGVAEHIPIVEKARGHFRELLLLQLQVLGQRPWRGLGTGCDRS